MDFGAPAVATLQRQWQGDDSELVIHYRVPIAWLELRSMPANARTARSEGRLEGRIGLASATSGRPIVHESSFELGMRGVVAAAGASYASPWSLRSTRLSAQRTRVTTSSLASRLGSAPTVATGY
jgi:hypothetical protein